MSSVLGLVETTSYARPAYLKGTQSCAPPVCRRSDDFSERVGSSLCSFFSLRSQKLHYSFLEIDQTKPQLSRTDILFLCSLSRRLTLQTKTKPFNNIYLELHGLYSSQTAVHRICGRGRCRGESKRCMYSLETDD